MSQIERQSYRSPISSDLLKYGTDDAGTLVKDKIILERLENQIETYYEDIRVLKDNKNLDDFLVLLSEVSTIVYFESYIGYAFDNENRGLLTISKNDNSISFGVYGDNDYIDCIRSLVKKSNLVEYANSLEWYYNDKGHSVRIPVVHDRLPCNEMYPFLGDEDLKDYYQRYLDSDSSVLLLIGPPGTGKTSFLKGLLSYSQSSASISYNTRLLDDDEIFVNFLTGSSRFMIMEDCDNFLESREDGNNMMHRFLNISDGLVSIKGKKMIFTTNLPNTNDIDPALIRPGRCFDILKFEALSVTDAEKLATKYDKKLVGDKNEYTIADIFGTPQEHSHKSERRIGFI